MKKTNYLLKKFRKFSIIVKKCFYKISTLKNDLNYDESWKYLLKLYIPKDKKSIFR